MIASSASQNRRDLPSRWREAHGWGGCSHQFGGCRVIGTVFGFDDLQLVHEDMDANMANGKIVIVVL